MENVNDIASHSEEVTPQETTSPQVDDQQQAVNDALAAFGLDVPQDSQETADDEPEAPPTEPEPERKGIKVKYNKEEVFIDEDKIPEYARKGLNYEKVEGRAKEYEAALDRAARLNGFKDHAEYVANLDRLEQESQKRQQDQFDQLRQSMRAEAEEAGIDPERLDAWLDNHPMLQQAKEVLEKTQQQEQIRKQEEEQQLVVQGWEALFRKYPELTEELPQEEGTAAPWLTSDMQAKLQRGYDPIDAYELVHRDRILSEQRKRAEQDVLKQQRLNKRAPIPGAQTADPEPEVPAELADAFEIFGLGKKAAKKYVKRGN